MNPIYKILQVLPTNGWTTAIGAIGLLAYGIGGLITNNLEPEIAYAAILTGWTALGLGSKLEKLRNK